MDGGYVCTPKQNVPEAERGLTSYPGKWRPAEPHDLQIKHLYTLIYLNTIKIQKYDMVQNN